MTASTIPETRSCDRPCGRFAPSPSGRMHLGNIYSALSAWLSARSRGGRMVLRIEDLDERCRRGKWDGQLIDDLRWLGLDWDEGPFYQSDRIDLYDEALAALRDQDLIYPCFCTRAELHAASAPHASDGTPIYSGACRNLSANEVSHRCKTRKPAMRLRVPKPCDKSDTVEFYDETYGMQREVLSRDCGDFLVRRSDGVYAYQLVVVVDDALMGVTEVVRGRDLLPSTARQIYLQDLLGYEHPRYAHVPMLLSPDGRRLSKRDRDCDMHELKAIFGTAEKLIGHIAHAAGIIPSPTPCSASRLADAFTWDLVRSNSTDITIA